MPQRKNKFKVIEFIYFGQKTASTAAPPEKTIKIIVLCIFWKEKMMIYDCDLLTLFYFIIQLILCCSVWHLFLIIALFLSLPYLKIIFYFFRFPYKWKIGMKWMLSVVNTEAQNFTYELQFGFSLPQFLWNCSIECAILLFVLTCLTYPSCKLLKWLL